MNHAFNSFHPSPNLVLFCLPSAVPNTNATGASAHACARVRSLSPPNSRTLVPSPSVSTRIIHQARIVRTPICTTSTVIALPSSLAIPSSCRVRVARGFSSGPPHLSALSFPFLAGQLSIKDEHFRGAGGYWQSYFCMHHDVSTMRPGYKGISQKWA